MYGDSIINTGVHDLQNEDGLLLYPNPTESKVELFYENIAYTKVDVYNVFGQRIFAKHYCRSVDLSAYGNGLYLFAICDLKKQLTFTRVVVLKK